MCVFFTVPTGFHAFGALVAIKIKKILLVMMLLLGTALTTKLFSGLFPFLGYGYGGGHFPCQYSKPVFIKEVEYERPHYHNKDFENYERPQYEEQYQRSAADQLSFFQEMLTAVQKR